MPAATETSSDGEGAAAETPDDLVVVGLLRGAYGLKGWSHVQALADDGAALMACRQWWNLGREALPGRKDDAARLLEVSAVRRQGDSLVAKWRGCDDPESAQALKGCRVAVSRARFPVLPEGEFYWVDLIGARVVNRAGVSLGTVSGLRSNGAHDVLEVLGGAAGDGKGAARTHLIPLVAAYVDSIDLAGYGIKVDWEEEW